MGAEVFEREGRLRQVSGIYWPPNGKAFRFKVIMRTECERCYRSGDRRRSTCSVTILAVKAAKEAAESGVALSVIDLTRESIHEYSATVVSA